MLVKLNMQCGNEAQNHKKKLSSGMTRRLITQNCFLMTTYSGKGPPPLRPQASLARSTLNRKYSECKPLKTDISDLQIPFFYNNIY